MAFSEARRQGFSPGTSVSSPPSSVNSFSQQNKARINLCYKQQLSYSFVPRGTRYAARDVRSMCCT